MSKRSKLAEGFAKKYGGGASAAYDFVAKRKVSFAGRSAKRKSPGDVVKAVKKNWRRKLNVPAFDEYKELHAPSAFDYPAGIKSKRKQMRGRGKRRFGGKRKRFGSSRRKGYLAKRGKVSGTSRFAKMVKSVVTDEMLADNTYVSTWVDAIDQSGTTNSVAKQYMWCLNENASIGLAAQTRPNLCVDDPTVLNAICNTIANGGNTCNLIRKSYETSCTLTNANTAPVEIWEYRCKARRDIDAKQVTNLDTLLQQGLSDTQKGVNASVSYIVPGVTPYMSPDFIQQFKIVKVKKFILRPAQWKRFTYKVMKPKKYNEERLDPIQAGSIEMLRGSSFSLFAAQGTYATNGAANATYRQGLSNINIGLVHQVKVHYSFISDVSVATGQNNYAPGFTFQADAVPMPITWNQPLSVLQSGSTALQGVPTGLRTYEGAGGAVAIAPDIPLVSQSV